MVIYLLLFDGHYQIYTGDFVKIETDDRLAIASRTNSAEDNDSGFYAVEINVYLRIVNFTTNDRLMI